MKNYLKEKIFTDFDVLIVELHPEIKEYSRRKLASALAESCYDTYIKNSEELVKLNAEVILSLEQNRKQFKDYIDLLQSKTNRMLDKFKSESFVKKEYDSYSQKYILKGRTKMVDDMVDLLNLLNEQVILFYKNVYKVEQQSIENQQINLF